MSKRSGFAPYFEALETYRKRGLLEKVSEISSGTFAHSIWYKNVYFEKSGINMELTLEDAEEGIVRRLTLPISPLFDKVKQRRGIFTTFRLGRPGLAGFVSAQFSVAGIS